MRTSWGRSESPSQGRPLNVSLRRPLYVISGPPQDVRSGRPRDGQIGPLGDVLGTLEGDVLGTSQGPIFAGWEASTLSKIYQHQSQITKSSLHLKKHLKSTKKSKEFEKNDKVLGDVTKYWEMRLAFYYISRWQNTQSELRHLNIRQRP